jgi:hypothetical protein
MKAMKNNIKLIKIINAIHDEKKMKIITNK